MIHVDSAQIGRIRMGRRTYTIDGDPNMTAMRRYQPKKWLFDVVGVKEYEWRSLTGGKGRDAKEAVAFHSGEELQNLRVNMLRSAGSLFRQIDEKGETLGIVMPRTARPIELTAGVWLPGSEDLKGEFRGLTEGETLKPVALGLSAADVVSRYPQLLLAR